jgi:pimeloyl-ACP methyl ester carboxylesterase
MFPNSSAQFAETCNRDGEFRIAARHWTGGLRFEAPSGELTLRLVDGVASAAPAPPDEAGFIRLGAPESTWEKLLAAKPPRFFKDISQLTSQTDMTVGGDPVLYAQYYAAVMRAVELLRPPLAVPAAQERRPHGTIDSAVGRYIHLDLQGQDYRIYFEEAGQGIPILLQHTAGCHGAQWRHLFERPEITSRFRLIAYDLPFHGKSLPPVGPKWWAEEYRLEAGFLRSIPVTLAQALNLDRPVYMGCSVGGLLALDLALHHADLFSAVIAVEGALNIDVPFETLDALWHPQISNDYKARMMDSLMSPTSPEAYRKETSQVYAAGWPAAFRGDLWYYVVDCDLRETAVRIDTSKVAVHILNGEYDASGTMELGQAAHAAIAGSTWRGMEGVGHFPMSENPDAFMEYLLPILDRIAADRSAA